MVVRTKIEKRIRVSVGSPGEAGLLEGIVLKHPSVTGFPLRLMT